MTGVLPTLFAAEPAVAWWVWVGFVALIVALLVVDLKVVMAGDEKISTTKAAWYSAGWIAISLTFGLVVLVGLGGSAAGDYYTGYVLEKSLSIDNVFVWAVLLGWFAVPDEYQHRVLFWGVFGALALRAGFIFAGVALLESLSWITYVFGGILLFTAWRVAFGSDEQVDPESNPVLRAVRRVLPETEGYEGHDFVVRRSGRWMVTPLLVVLVSIELTDVLFAVDSVPAVLAVTEEQFLVFSSNAFAILGLRALYFLLAGLKDRFTLIEPALGIVLAFVGVKFLAEGFVEVPTWVTLAVVLVVVSGAMALSWRREPEAEPEGA